MKKNSTILILIFIVVFFSALVIFGTPTEFKITGAPPFIEMTWKTEKTELPEIIKKQTKKDVIIHSFDTRQDIYIPGDKVYVDFLIENTLNVSYNVTVDWIHNDTRYYGWFNISSDYHNNSNANISWRSWYEDLPFDGFWQVQLIVDYSVENKEYSKDEVVEFKII